RDRLRCSTWPVRVLKYQPLSGSGSSVLMRAPRPACLSTTLSMVAARCRSINSAWSPIGPVRALDGLAGGAELLRTGAVLGREWAAVLARRRLLRRWHRDSARRGGRVVRLGSRSERRRRLLVRLVRHHVPLGLGPDVHRHRRRL